MGPSDKAKLKTRCVPQLSIESPERDESQLIKLNLYTGLCNSFNRNRTFRVVKLNESKNGAIILFSVNFLRHFNFWQPRGYRQVIKRVRRFRNRLSEENDNG